MLPKKKKKEGRIVIDLIIKNKTPFSEFGLRYLKPILPSNNFL